MAHLTLQLGAALVVPFSVPRRMNRHGFFGRNQHDPKQLALAAGWQSNHHARVNWRDRAMREALFAAPERSSGEWPCLEPHPSARTTPAAVPRRPAPFYPSGAAMPGDVS